MPDEENILELKLPDGTEHRLRGWKAIENWHDRFQKAWAWLRDGAGDDPSSVRPNAINMLDQLQNTMRNARSNNQSPASVGPAIVNTWRKAWSPPHQDSDAGRRVLDILADSGPEAALFALGLAKGQLHFGNAVGPLQGRGAVQYALPSLITGEAVAGRIDSERRQAKSDLKSALASLEDAERTRQAAFEHFMRESAERGLANVKLRARRQAKQNKLWSDAAQAAINRIDDVASTYNTFMTLKAPVEYWKKKSQEHKTSETTMLRWTVKFFGAALVVVSVLFSCVGVYLVGLDKNSVHPSIFFVSSAGLASIVALILWGGRLITKIYLSEQHLRQDAYERETMTQTFMALVAEKVASEDDRQIVLNALFRPTSDGIVREEGGLDPSIASALAKFLARSP